MGARASAAVHCIHEGRGRDEKRTGVEGKGGGREDIFLTSWAAANKLVWMNESVCVLLLKKKSEKERKKDKICDTGVGRAVGWGGAAALRQNT